MVGDIQQLLVALTEYAPSGSDWGEAAARIYRDQLADALDVKTAGLAPQRLVEVAREVLPRDTIATCDAGASRLHQLGRRRCGTAVGRSTAHGVALGGRHLGAGQQREVVVGQQVARHRRRFAMDRSPRFVTHAPAPVCAPPATVAGARP